MLTLIDSSPPGGFCGRIHSGGIFVLWPQRKLEEMEKLEMERVNGGMVLGHIPEVPRDRLVERRLSRMAGMTMGEFRRTCSGVNLQCLACGKVLRSPRRKLCDDACRRVFMERLREMGLA